LTNILHYGKHSKIGNYFSKKYFKPKQMRPLLNKMYFFFLF